MAVSTAQQATTAWNFEDFFEQVDDLLEVIANGELKVFSRSSKKKSDEQCRAILLSELQRLADRRNSRFYSPFEELERLPVRFTGSAQLKKLAEGLCNGQALGVLRDASRA